MILTILFLVNQFTMPYESRVFVDYDGNFLVYARYYQGILLSIDSIVPIPSYLKTGLYQHNRTMLLGELKREILKSTGYAGKGVFGTFEIPLPRGGFSDFMGETGKLDVGGYVKVTLGGAKTFTSGMPGVESFSLWPELQMEQEMAINLDGQVGDRMRVFIDHSSTRIDETQNKVRVTYKGKEDEIIQEIEGGDTQLSIPPTTYTGDIPSHQGLFGIKSTSKFGPMEVVAIASREQTQTEELERTGTTTIATDSIFSKDYEKRRFFWLGTGDSIIELKVFVYDENQSNNNNNITRIANAILDANDDNLPDDSSQTLTGYFTLKNEGYDRDYTFIPKANIIELKQGLQYNAEGLGVYYRKIDNSGKEDTVGILPPGQDTIQLKLLCPKNYPDTSSILWHYELKNYYQITAAGASLDSVQIYYMDPSGINDYKDNLGRTYLYLLGLDNDKNGIVDNYNGLGGFDRYRGLLVFPEPMPFIDSILPEPDYQIYYNPYQPNLLGKYYIKKRALTTQRVFDLPPNTKRVTVYVNDKQLDSTDYFVDYDEGKLELKVPIAPTDRIRIQIEYSPFFSISQKSLFGLRGSSKILGDGTLGSSFFYRTESFQTAPYQHIRLDEEPYNRMVFETDFSLPKSLPFLTNLIDNLPLIATEAESKLNLNLEGAYSFSNLNSLKSVYIDDLEATTITNSAQITKLYWSFCSKPVNKDTANFALNPLIWFNPKEKERLFARDIYQNPIDPSDLADVLKIVFTPDNPQSFAGLSQYITSEDLTECENIELIIKGKGGRVHIDLAEEISEDQLRRNKKGEISGLGSLQDEDFRPHNFAFSEYEEDAGLDMVFGADGANIPGDDGNDDYNENDIKKINGTEGNRFYDTEDLDRNGVLNTNNHYHSFSVHLDSSKFWVDAGLKPGWQMFRIPIKDSILRDTTVGNPHWENIRYIRIWFDGFSSPETLLLYKLNIIGSRWKNYGILGENVDSSETFTIAPVNTETHSYYKPPYPLPIDPITGKKINEGGLELNLQNIKTDHICVAHRRTDKIEDYRAYDTLVFYFRALHSNPEIILRFGADSTNYYEFKSRYEEGIPGYNEWREFRIAFENFLNLKRETMGNGELTQGNYTVKGNPSIATNSYFELRLKNTFATPLTDTVWFNDIKLRNPKNEVGRIFKGNGSLTFADLSTISLAYEESNGRFKRLSETNALSQQGIVKNFGTNASFALNKFLPESWGFNIPLGLSYYRSKQQPRFSSFIANDLELDESERKKEEEINTTGGYTIRLTKSGSKNWLLKHTLDRLSFDHDRTVSASFAPRRADTSEIRNYRGGYSLEPNLSFSLLRQQFSVLPQNLSFNAHYSDSRVKSYYRNTLDSAYKTLEGYPQHRRTLNPSFSLNYSPHKIINTGYSFSQNRDSVSEKRRFGEEVGRNQSFNASASRSLVIFNPTVSFNTGYNEEHTFEMRQPQDYRSISNNSRINLSSSFDLRKFLRFFTTMRDESKDTLQIPGSPLWILRQIEIFVDYIENPMFSFSRQKGSGYYSTVRPDLRYQWGLLDTIPRDEIAPGSYSTRSVSDNYNINSGLRYKILNLNGGYGYQVTRNFTLSGNENRTVSYTYPNADLRISRVEMLPFLKKYTHSSSVNLNFNQNYQRQYTVTPDTLPELTSFSKSISLNPLLGWQANWVKGITTNTSVNYSQTDALQYAGSYVNPTRSVNRGGSFSIGYTFSAPGGLSLPFLKGIKFASNMSTSFDVNYSRNTTYAASQENPDVLDLAHPTSDGESMSFGISMNYNFSSSVTGGADFDYSASKDRTLLLTDTKRVNLNIWVNINF
uniref:Gliding motility protein SprA N-terminal domain-containing protein n=1 Tax=candidate division WOR-3 bacterium TaxID=2052148 RepID=A0A7C4XB48_UNCW3